MQALTTGTAAKLMNVSQQAVIRLLTSGHLKCYRVPMSRHRRIDPRELAGYMRSVDFPEDMIERVSALSRPREVWLMNFTAAHDSLIKLLEGAFSGSEVRFKTFDSSFSAGLTFDRELLTPPTVLFSLAGFHRIPKFVSSVQMRLAGVIDSTGNSTESNPSDLDQWHYPLFSMSTDWALLKKFISKPYRPSIEPTCSNGSQSNGNGKR